MTAPRDGHGLREARHYVELTATLNGQPIEPMPGPPEVLPPIALQHALIWQAFVAVAARGRLGAGGLARRLKITRPHAAALLAELEARGALFENYRGGRGGIYRPAVAGFPPAVCL